MPSWSPARWGRRRCSTTTASGLRGLVLEEGGPHSHVAIVARALGIPAVGEHRQRHRHRRSRRRHHRRRHGGRFADAPAARHGGGLRRTRAAARAAPAAISRAARQAVRHQGRRRGDVIDQCRAERRPAAYRRHRRRRHRPVPHRAAIHGGAEFPALERAVYALSRGARCRRRQAGDLPHARYRRRQGAALYAQRRGGKSGARLARHPARARPARPCCARNCARCCAPPAGAR